MTRVDGVEWSVAAWEKHMSSRGLKNIEELCEIGTGYEKYGAQKTRHTQQ